ncbi:MAG: hypothetical protein M3Y67_06260 [Pseudomonadota bacterium]|nr:hypothetical protein [Pseudomonadota bacterium]
MLTRLSSAADALARRRAAEIAEPDVNDYVGLGWMRWNGGRIDLTELGHNLLRSMNLYQAVAADEESADEPAPDGAAESQPAAPPAPAASTRAHALKHRVADLVKRREKHRRALAINARSRDISRS